MSDSPKPSLASRLEGVLRIREPIGIPLRIVLGLIPILGIFALWALLTRGAYEERVISVAILPSPFEVLHSFKTLWFNAELSRSILASLQRVVGGFLVALAVAFPLGMLMGSFTKIKAMFEPLALFGAYMPIPVLVPLTMSVFGIDEKQKIIFLSIAFIVYLLPLFVKAIDEVDAIYLQTAQSLGANTWQIVRHVLFGIAFPRLFQAMRLGFGVGWSYIILAEIVDAPRGLGHIIINAQRIGPREHIYLTVVVIVLIAYITDKVWVHLGRLLFPYQEFS